MLGHGSQPGRSSIVWRPMFVDGALSRKRRGWDLVKGLGVEIVTKAARRRAKSVIVRPIGS